MSVPVNVQEIKQAVDVLYVLRHPRTSSQTHLQAVFHPRTGIQSSEATTIPDIVLDAVLWSVGILCHVPQLAALLGERSRGFKAEVANRRSRVGNS